MNDHTPKQPHSGRGDLGNSWLPKPFGTALVKVLGLVMLFVWVLGGLHVLFPLDLSRLSDNARQVLDHDHMPLHMVRSPKEDLWRFPANIRNIDPQFIKGLVHVEDQYFFSHFGVNPFSILRAFIGNIAKGKIISGASTITMQTVRLLERRPRTMTAKMIEVIRAFQLELSYTKAEILEMYLTLAPYGGNIEGIRAACLAFFDHEPRVLSAAETALLIAIPRAPNRLRPTLNSPLTQKNRNLILKKMQKARLINDDIFNRARQHPCPSTLYPFPKGAPHFSRRLFARYPTKQSIESTLDSGLQSKVALIAATSLPNDLPLNVAILVIDQTKKEIIGYVASRDFENEQESGQVDFIQAIRSPGSILKPLIYGFAFDKGVVRPDTIVNDQAIRYGNYHPANFSKQFHGALRVKDALRLSLNTIAVDLLVQSGVNAFWDKLKEADITLKLPSSEDGTDGPNAALALGGVGTTLESLSTLYSIFYHGGIVTPHSDIKSDIKSDSTSNPKNTVQKEAPLLMTANSAKSIIKILTDDGLNTSVSGKSARRIFYKTGTSHGHRDALVLGGDHRYLISIWVGYADNRSMGNQTGETLAVPMMHKVLQQLPYTENPCRAPSLNTTNASYHFKTFSEADQTVATTFRILFPTDQSILMRPPSDEAIPFQTMQGKAPLKWFINAAPPFVQETLDTPFYWKPKEPGFYRVTALDAAGRSASVMIEVREFEVTSKVH